MFAVTFSVKGLLAMFGSPRAETSAETSTTEVIHGNGGEDLLEGELGTGTLFGSSSTLIGGTGSDLTARGAGNTGTGNGTMSVGAGDGSFIADSTDSAGDTILDAPGAGTDHVFASVRHTFAANVERPILTGTAVITGTGTSEANRVTGNAADNILDGRSGADILVGGLGDDTYVVDHVGDVVIELASQGTDTVLSSISYTLGDHVENLTLSGGSSVNATGNDSANVIRGNDHHNIIDGRGGVDTLIGGDGDDTYIVNDADDTVVETPNGGTDTVRSVLDYTLGANIENLMLMGSGVINGAGNDLANGIMGNAAQNMLLGHGGDDTLDGGEGSDTLDGGAGADVMDGGSGDDTFVVDDAGDHVIESDGGGTDTVLSSVSFALASHLENLSLTGDSNINATGNSAANLLIGNSGANVLDGRTGSDMMVGGTGNDTYFVDSAGDFVVEDDSDGVDDVRSSVSYMLTAGVENLTLLGAGHLSATGNAIANVLVGNSGNNVIDGGGGADAMSGGAGSDTYIVDHAGDVITELANEGIDTVLASVSTVLSAHVEHLVLTGAAAINGTGNALENIMTGNAGNNIIDGGMSADLMTGGLGDDTYYIDHASDRVIENPGQGNDHVITTISIGSIDGVERITLAGTGSIDLSGNGLDNILTGNGAANIMSGGDGKDTLSGGAGDDKLFGDGGDDTLSGHDGNDTLIGGSGIDAMNGGAGNDVMDGGDGNDGMFGGGAQDYLFGGLGNDRIYGDGGNDVIRSGAGHDTLAGGSLSGAGISGNDTFAWTRADIVDANGVSAGFDTILDFGAGDRLDFTGIFSAAPPIPLADLIRVSDTPAGTIVSLDIDANGHFFDVAILNGLHGLDAQDFMQQHFVVA